MTAAPQALNYICYINGGSSIATITVLEESHDPILLFQIDIISCHVYNSLRIIYISFVIFDMDLLHEVKDKHTFLLLM